MSQRKAVTKTIAARYKRSKRSAKKIILDELCAITGWHRDHARTALREVLVFRKVKPRPPRPVLYGEAVIEALRFCWAVQGTPCGRLLAAALIDLVPRLRAFDELQINEAMSGLFRIARLGGVVVSSVMSLLGAWRHFLDDVITVAETFGDNANDAMLRTGDLRHIGGAHVCQMFRASDITKLVQRCGGEVLATSASNWASLDKPETLTILKTDPDRWRRFLEHEVAACAELGAVDGGTHLTICGAKYRGELNLPGQPHQSFIQVHLGVLSRGLV